MNRFFFVVFLAVLAGKSLAQDLASSLGPLSVTTIAKGFKGPWGMDFLPDGRLIVTEKRGRLFVVESDGRRTRIGGVPKVRDRGQGGLLDVHVSEDFASDGLIFLSYAKAQSGGAGTTVASAKLDLTQQMLTGLNDIFEMNAGSEGGVHFGSRLVQDSDGYLYITVGDRGDRPSAQDLSRQNGSVLRINTDGTSPGDNPFATSDSAPQIWSYGHRNPQGMAVDAKGNIWTVEHGPKGGDEINQIRKGLNYGWPVISYGVHYSGALIGEGTAKDGMEQPAFYWDPSIAPSGMMIYKGEMFPQWQGDIFVGSLKFDYIARLSGTALTEVEQLSGRETQRVRDIAEAPDGSIYVMSEDLGTIFRLSR